MERMHGHNIPVNRAQKKSAVILTIFFSLVVVLLAFHYHRANLNLPFCSICTIKGAMTSDNVQVEPDNLPLVSRLKEKVIVPRLFSSSLVLSPLLPFSVLHALRLQGNKAPPPGNHIF